MLRASLHPKKFGLLYLALTLESWGKGLKGLEMEMCIPSMAPCIEGNLHWILSFAMTFCSLLLFSQRNQPLVNLVDNIIDFVKNEKHCGSACSKKLRPNEKVHCCTDLRVVHATLISMRIKLHYFVVCFNIKALKLISNLKQYDFILKLQRYIRTRWKLKWFEESMRCYKICATKIKRWNGATLKE